MRALGWYLFIMKSIFLKKLFALLIPAALSVSLVYAQSPPVDVHPLSEIVVTATRMPQALTDLVADVTIIDRVTIQRSGAIGLADVLALVPGIQISRPGNVGSPTSVYLRGAESRYTAVFIDGVRVDSQSTGGASWQTIPLSYAHARSNVRPCNQVVDATSELIWE